MRSFNTLSCRSLKILQGSAFNSDERIKKNELTLENIFEMINPSHWKKKYKSFKGVEYHASSKGWSDS